MTNKKLMLFAIFFIGLMAVSAVSAQDADNSTATSIESENIDTLSVDENIKNTDVLNDDVNNNKSAEINCVQEENFLVVRVVDSDGKNLTEGDFTFISEDSDVYYGRLAGNPFYLLNLYDFEYDEFPQNLFINFVNKDYNVSTSFFCTLNNTIIAHDVFNESSFSATFLGNDYIPVNKGYMSFIVDDGDSYYNEFYISTNENGKAVLDLALEPANYTVFVWNTISGQKAYFNWNVTQRDPAKKSRINVTSNGYTIFFNLVDGLNNTVGKCNFKMYVNGTQHAYSADKSFNFFSLGEGTYVIDLVYDDFYYYPSNATLVVDVIDAIRVNDSFYNTTVVDALLLDSNGQPLVNGPFRFYTDDYSYFGYTDENGHAIADLSLLPGVYNVKVSHNLAGQYKTFGLEVLEEYDYKKVLINVTQVELRVIINVTDLNGNKIDGGYVYVDNGFMGDTIELINGTAIYVYDEGIYGTYVEEKKRLSIVLQNMDYYETGVYYWFDFVNTIISEDVKPGKQFNVTFLDTNKNPVAGMEVEFSFHDYVDERFQPLGNMTGITDENGTICLESNEKYFSYIVSFINPLTGQNGRNVWLKKDIVEITPVFDYFDESDGIYYVNGQVFAIEVSPSDATGSIVLEDEMYIYNPRIVNGHASIWLPEFGRHDWMIYYPGDSRYNATIFYYSIVNCEMDLPTMTISENMVVNSSKGANFTVNLANGTNPIANAFVEITIGNYTYVLLTDEQGNVSLPITVGAGEYDVLVNYKGSPSYAHVNKTTTLIVRDQSSLTICDVVMDYDSLAYVSVASEGAVGIIAKIDDADATVIGNSIVISGLGAGSHTLSVTTIPDYTHYTVTQQASITVNKVNTQLSASSISITYNADKDLVITLKDNQNRPISGVKISVSLNGSKKLKTDKNGQVKVSVGTMVPKKYSASITFAGDSNYLKSTKKVTVNVKKATPKMTAKKKTFKKSAKTKKYSITLKTNKNKAMKKVKVTIKVNKKKYTAKTNKKGVATFKLKKLTKKGKFKATVTYKGNKYYKKVTKKVKITVK